MNRIPNAVIEKHYTSQLADVLAAEQKAIRKAIMWVDHSRPDLITRHADGSALKDTSRTALMDGLVKNMMHYVGADLGRLCIVNKANPADTFLEQISSLDFEAGCHCGMRISCDQGALGEAFLKGQTKYKGQSGSRAGAGRNVLAVCLKINGATVGMIELASVNPIHPSRIEFVEHLASSMAATVSALQISTRTRELLVSLNRTA